MLNKLSNNQKLMGAAVVSLVFMIMYQFLDVDMKFFEYAMHIRTPKMLAMLISAFCIGTATIVFQSIINNRIVTPCLLGMNSLYILTHTSIAFILGTSSMFVTNKNIAFMIDVVIMGFAAVTIYGYLFKKTRYNVLYVLLVGTVLATLFTSISNTMIRVMDPNEYATLQDSLIAGFGNVNSDVIGIAVALIIVVIIALRNELKVLDVITLGKSQAISLGVDYDRTIRRLLIGVTLFITIATALVGPISFLGLIVANVSRELFKTYKHSYLMLGAFLAGVVVLFFSQLLIEHVFSFSMVASVFINLFGGVYFLYLILKNKGV